jgi:hypothetical protein
VWLWTDHTSDTGQEGLPAHRAASLREGRTSETCKTLPHHRVLRWLRPSLLGQRRDGLEGEGQKNDLMPWPKWSTGCSGVSNRGCPWLLTCHRSRSESAGSAFNSPRGQGGMNLERLGAAPRVAGLEATMSPPTPRRETRQAGQGRWSHRCRCAPSRKVRGTCTHLCMHAGGSEIGSSSSEGAVETMKRFPPTWRHQEAAAGLAQTPAHFGEPLCCSTRVGDDRPASRRSKTSRRVTNLDSRYKKVHMRPCDAERCIGP